MPDRYGTDSPEFHAKIGTAQHIAVSSFVLIHEMMG